MLRVYHQHPRRDGLTPRTYGPTARFDPHVRDRHYRPRQDPQGRGVLYLGRDLGTGLAEFYSGQWPQVNICPRARAAWMHPSERIQLLDLTGNGAMKIGALGTLAAGDESRTRTQRWGRRIYEQYTHLDGIWYQAAHQGGESVVLWERAPALEAAARGDSSLWATWSYVIVALAAQGRQPRRINPSACRACREAGYD
jgi:hypothetical protein